MNRKEAIIVCVILVAAIGVAYLEWQYLPSLAIYDSQRIQNATLNGTQMGLAYCKQVIDRAILQQGKLQWLIQKDNETSYAMWLVPGNVTVVNNSEI